jgi:hypothetical protein
VCEAESSEVAAEVEVEVEELISKAAVVKFGRTIRLYSYKIIERKHVEMGYGRFHLPQLVLHVQ